MSTQRVPSDTSGGSPAAGAPTARRIARRGLRAAARLVPAALLALAPFGIAAQGATPAGAATTWEVQVGGDDQKDLLMTMAYFPGTLSIHAGDTVAGQFASFHTVTFNAGQD